MSKKVYVDSNIYIDYFDNREGKFATWGEFAFQFFRRTFECEFKIVMSAQIFKELNKLGYEENIDDLFYSLKDMEKIEFVFSSPKLNNEARDMKTSHYGDRLHYLLAKKAKVDFIVTRNWKDFYDFKDVEAFPPEFI
jgi:predicted nucleic acid-binding protein